MHVLIVLVMLYHIFMSILYQSTTSPSIVLNKEYDLCICGDWIDRCSYYHSSWSTEKSVVTALQAVKELCNNWDIDYCADEMEVIPVKEEDNVMKQIRNITKYFRSNVINRFYNTDDDDMFIPSVLPRPLEAITTLTNENYENCDPVIREIKCYKIPNKHHVQLEDFRNVTAAHSGDLMQFFSLFDSDYYVRDHVVCEVGPYDEIGVCSILFIDSIKIFEKFQGLGLGLYLVDEACRKINDHMSLTALCPSPLSRDYTTFQESEKGMVKLRKYFALLNFKPLGDNFLARWSESSESPALDLDKVCPHLY